MKRNLLIGIAAAIAAPVAIACAVIPVHPFKVDVSLWNIAVEWASGNRTSPANSAFLNELDKMGRNFYGQEVWRSNNFKGYVYPSTSIGGISGATQIYIEKPCGEGMRAQAGFWEGPGGNGGEGTYGGSYQTTPQGTYGITGFTPIYQPQNVCAGSTCSTVQMLVGYSAIWGFITGGNGPGGTFRER